MFRGILDLALLALTFSVSYAFVEYYVIRDTTIGYDPLLFSLVYPITCDGSRIWAGSLWFAVRPRSVTPGNLDPALVCRLEENPAGEYYHLRT
jgi:hypothetical protein